MKILMLLIILTGCSKYEEIQSNIDDFTNECERVAKCLEKDFKVKINLDGRNKLICAIKFSKVSEAYLYPESSLDIGVRPDFGYNYLEAALHTCKMAKEKGNYSKKEQDVHYRYAKCIDLAPGDESQKDACWEQYKNGDFHKEKE